MRAPSEMSQWCVMTRSRKWPASSSFSVALLNAAGDGIVLTSINGRSETRTYAKTVAAGKGVQPLSPEEEQSVRSARLGQGAPPVPTQGTAPQDRVSFVPSTSPNKR